MIDLPLTNAAAELLATGLAKNNLDHRAVYLQSLHALIRLALAESNSAPIIAARNDMLQVDAILEVSKKS